ncbi:aldo/keto reductase [Micromonospora sp. NPDC004704]
MPVERIIFGTMTLGYHGRGVRVRDTSTARRMLDHFHSRGYREIDTCYVYGDGSCEQMLGDLRTHDHFKIALRYDPVATARGHEPEVLRASLSNIAPEDVEETLAIVAREGWVRPTVYQGLYNAASRSPEAELLPLLHEQGIRFYAYNPLAGGAFASGFGNDESVSTGSRFDQGHPQGIEYRRRYWNEPYLHAMREFRAGCEAWGVLPTDAALRWLVHHSHLGAAHGDGIILGASRPEHLVQNLDGVQGTPLPPELLVAMDLASETTRPAWPSMRRA